MSDTSELRRAALEIFYAALKRMDAAEAVAGAVKLDGSRLYVADESFNLADAARRRAGVYVIAVGKAALPMARALDAILGDHVTAGLVVGPSTRRARGYATAASAVASSFNARWRIMQGGHPLPNRASLMAAQAAFELLERAGARRALVIFLISGGGSAMIEWPRDERITLRELRAANRALVSCGAGIAEINSVRRAFSAIKGGGLAAHAARADQLSLIVSDTGAGEEANVASGPTLDPPLDAPDVKEVIARYGLAKRLPASILRAINQSTMSNIAAPVRALRAHYVLLDNRRAMEAAARAARGRGFAVELARDIVEQPVADGCTQLLKRLQALRRRIKDERKVVCLISGGEFACPVRGRGVGGRNAETVLRCAIELGAGERSRRAASSSLSAANVVALSAGTDGIDGNSPAAGAIIDRTTIRRARRIGLDARRFLDASDAYSFFDALGDTIVMGPTGTNVRDLRVLLAL